LTASPLPRETALGNSDLIEFIDRVTVGLAKTLTLVESIRDQSARDGNGSIHHHRTERLAQAGRQRRLDSDLLITVTPKGRTVHHRPAPTIGLRSANYEVLSTWSASRFY
jgi:hypothetical protein